MWDAGTAAWIQKAPLTNPKLSSAALAFDEARGTAVLFGGVFYNQRQNGIGGLAHVVNSTWIWNGLDWKVVESAAGPSARTASR